MLQKEIIKSPVFIILVILTIIATIYLLYKINFPSTYTLNQSTMIWPSAVSKETKTYQSKSLNLKITYHNKFQVKEKLGRIVIENLEGQILLNRLGTNFDTLNGYIDDLLVKNKTSLTDRVSLKINTLDTVHGILNGEKIYFIYVDNWVYSLSTSSETLYNDLDQIAESFQYIP